MAQARQKVRSKIRKNDMVMVVKGRDRGKTGKVLRVRPEDGRVRVERLNGGRVRVTVALDDAKSAAIAGDWNDWSPAPMSRTKAGRWTTVIQVVPGVHRFSILVDGTRWIVPSVAPQASDGFGGQAALLVIPDA